MDKLDKISIIGAGSWGTALGCLAARSAREVMIYSNDPAITYEINSSCRNTKYFNDTELHENLIATSQIKDTLKADIIILAIPSYAFSEILELLKSHGLKPSTILLIATKGLSENPVQFLSDKIESEFENPYAFISGPNMALEVVRNKFTAMTISSKDLSLAAKLADVFKSDMLDVTISDDIITIQIASIVKNIIAIRSGIMKSAGDGENAKAWLISTALAEISIISKALGGKPEANIALPAVIGDLVLTCYSDISRNTRFGYEFHTHNYSKEFLTTYPLLVEGISSARLLGSLIKTYDLELPLISSIIDLLHVNYS
ncbi:MAG: NAD(P)H-dependent glycerol-3-phosphate dehydrogenase [Rickettsiales bacterium]|nr:MAG: NAD(P)H-dependent glycerol-3-phosphate dehydrogenase [Rickettsiales bacterium]